jgi:hypothetical protein
LERQLKNKSWLWSYCLKTAWCLLPSIRYSEWKGVLRRW